MAKERRHIWVYNLYTGHFDFSKEMVIKFETQLLDFDNLARYVAVLVSGLIVE